MANPALTIDVDAKTSKYDKAMDSIGDTADKKVAEIEAKFESFDPQLNTENYTKSLTSMVAGFSVVGVGAAAVITLVAALNKSLADTASIADRVGLSVERFQQIKFGANSLGVGDDNLTGSLDRFATNLQNAKFVANDLTRVFAANGVAIKDANGNIKDTNTLLTSAVGIVKGFPKLQDALQVGTMLGFSREFSQSIHDAGDNFLRLAAQANDAGAVIDDATIKKAKEFSAEWQKAAAIWGTSLKASIGDILPLLNDAVNGAVAVISAIKSAYSFISAIKDFAIAPNIETASLNQLNNLLKQYQDIKATLDSGKPLNPIQLFQGTNIQDENQQITAAAVDKAIANVNEQIAKRQKDVKPIRVPVTGGSTNPGPAQSDGGRDQFEQTVDQLSKRTAALNADTIAITQNKEAQAQLRAEFQLLAAIVRDGGEVTDEQVKRYEALRATMGQQEALVAAGITLNAEHANSFRNVSDGIASATGKYTQAQDSLQKLNNASQQLGSALSSAFGDALFEAKSFDEAVNNLIKTLGKAAVNNLFASFFNQQAGGGLSPFLKLFGVGSNASGTDNWRGGDTWVGENGPEIVRPPAGSQIIPNSVAKKSTGGVSVVIQQQNTYSAGMQPGDIATVDALVKRNNPVVIAATIDAVRKGTKNDSRFLGQ